MSHICSVENKCLQWSSQTSCRPYCVAESLCWQALSCWICSVPFRCRNGSRMGWMMFWMYRGLFSVPYPKSKSIPISGACLLWVKTFYKVSISRSITHTCKWKPLAWRKNLISSVYTMKYHSNTERILSQHHWTHV